MMSRDGPGEKQRVPDSSDKQETQPKECSLPFEIGNGGWSDDEHGPENDGVEHGLGRRKRRGACPSLGPYEPARAASTPNRLTTIPAPASAHQPCWDSSAPSLLADTPAPTAPMALTAAPTSSGNSSRRPAARTIERTSAFAAIGLSTKAATSRCHRCTTAGRCSCLPERHQSVNSAPIPTPRTTIASVVCPPARRRIARKQAAAPTPRCRRVRRDSSSLIHNPPLAPSTGRLNHFLRHHRSAPQPLRHDYDYGGA